MKVTNKFKSDSIKNSFIRVVNIFNAFFDEFKVISNEEEMKIKNKCCRKFIIVRYNYFIIKSWTLTVILI